MTVPTTTKTCRSCSNTLPIGQFPRWPSSFDGHRHVCIPCADNERETQRHRRAQLNAESRERRRAQEKADLKEFGYRWQRTPPREGSSEWGWQLLDADSNVVTKSQALERIERHRYNEQDHDYPDDVPIEPWLLPGWDGTVPDESPAPGAVDTAGNADGDDRLGVLTSSDHEHAEDIYKFEAPMTRQDLVMLRDSLGQLEPGDVVTATFFIRAYGTFSVTGPVRHTLAEHVWVLASYHLNENEMGDPAGSLISLELVRKASAGSWLPRIDPDELYGSCIGD